MTTPTSPMDRMQVADHLDAAADVLLLYGQAKGKWFDQETGAVCGSEALLLAIAQTDVCRTNVGIMQVCPHTARAFAMWILANVSDDVIKLLNFRSAIGNPTNIIIKANDNTGTDMEQAMRQCAKFLREAEGDKSA